MEGSVPWGEKTNFVLRYISAPPAGIAAFTFFEGFKINIYRCEPLQGVDLLEFGDAVPGEIVGFRHGQLPTVRTGSGALIVTSYEIVVAGEACHDIQEFIRVMQPNRPYRLTTAPFLTNAASTLWEIRVDRWRSQGSERPGPNRRRSGSASSVLTLTKYLRGLTQRSRRFLEDLTHRLVPRSESKVSAKSQTTYATDLIQKNRRFLEDLISRLGLRPGSKVLDIGCGSGWACWLFRDLGMEVFGLDVLPRAIAAAQRLVPDGRFFVSDVCDLHHRDDLKGQFDLVFCRDLGMAQKIIDWDDPVWVRTGKSIVEMLAPEGAVYWIQMTDSTDRVTSDGISNPSVHTLRRYFGRFAHVLDVRVFGYISLLMTHQPPSPKLAERIEEYDRQRSGAILSHYKEWSERSDDSRAARMSREIQRLVMKVAYQHLSRAFLLPQKEQRRGLVIAGEGTLASIYFYVARDLKLEVKAVTASQAKNGIWLRTPVLPLEEALLLDPGGLVLTGGPVQESSLGRWLSRNENRKSPPFLVVLPANEGRPLPPLDREEIFLISGDQDPHFEPTRQANLEGRNETLYSGPNLLQGDPLEACATDPKQPAHWSLEGVGAKIECTDIALKPGRCAARIRCGSCPASAIQRLAAPENLRRRRIAVGCWVCTADPGIARIEVTDGYERVASECHPGDGIWHFLTATKEIHRRARFIEVSLWVLGPGSAVFDRACLFLQSRGALGNSAARA